MSLQILIFNVIVVVSAALVMGYWYFLDALLFPTLTFNNDPHSYVTDKTVYSPGDPVSIYVDFCKNRDGVGTSAWSLIDTVQLFYPEKSANAPVGCYKGWVEAVTLPRIVEDGTYRLAGTTRVEINPIATDNYEFSTQDFYIKVND